MRIRSFNAVFRGDRWDRARVSTEPRVSLVSCIDDAGILCVGFHQSNEVFRRADRSDHCQRVFVGDALSQLLEYRENHVLVEIFFRQSKDFEKSTHGSGLKSS